MYPRRLIAAAILLAISCPALHAQYVEPLESTFILAVNDKTVWDLAFAYKDESYGTLTADQVFAEVDSTAKVYKDATIKKFRSQVRDLYTNLGANGAGSVFFIKGITPFSFVRHKGNIGVKVTSLATTETFDVTQVTPAKRASQVLESKILPLLGSFAAAFEKSKDVKFMAIQVTYGSLDPNVELDPTKGEAVMLVVSKSDCREYVDRKITAADLVKRSEVLVSDREHTSDYVTLTPEP